MNGLVLIRAFWHTTPLNFDQQIGRLGFALSILGVALSIIGIRLAQLSIRDGKRLTDTTELLITKASLIQDSLSTRYLNIYPDYIPAITKLINEATSEIVIMTISPAFGCFSAGTEWEKLSDALVSKQRAGIPITVITGETKNRRQNYYLQFKEAVDDWQAWLAGGRTHIYPSHQERLRDMCARRRIHCANTDADWFFRVMEDIQLASQRDTYYAATWRVVDNPIPVVAWIVGHEKAIFGISNPQGKPPAFITEDRNIIDSLLGLADRL